MFDHISSDLEEVRIALQSLIIDAQVTLDTMNKEEQDIVVRILQNYEYKRLPSELTTLTEKYFLCGKQARNFLRQHNRWK